MRGFREAKAGSSGGEGGIPPRQRIIDTIFGNLRRVVFCVSQAEMHEDFLYDFSFELPVEREALNRLIFYDVYDLHDPRRCGTAVWAKLSGATVDHGKALLLNIGI